MPRKTDQLAEDPEPSILESPLRRSTRTTKPSANLVLPAVIGARRRSSASSMASVTSVTSEPAGAPSARLTRARRPSLTLESTLEKAAPLEEDSLTPGRMRTRRSSITKAEESTTAARVGSPAVGHVTTRQRSQRSASKSPTSLKEHSQEGATTPAKLRGRRPSAEKQPPKRLGAIALASLDEEVEADTPTTKTNAPETDTSPVKDSKTIKSDFVKNLESSKSVKSSSFDILISSLKDSPKVVISPNTAKAAEHSIKSAVEPLILDMPNTSEQSPKRAITPLSPVRRSPRVSSESSSVDKLSGNSPSKHQSTILDSPKGSITLPSPENGKDSPKLQKAAVLESPKGSSPENVKDSPKLQKAAVLQSPKGSIMLPSPKNVKHSPKLQKAAVLESPKASATPPRPVIAKDSPKISKIAQETSPTINRTPNDSLFPVDKQSSPSPKAAITPSKTPERQTPGTLKLTITPSKTLQESLGTSNTIIDGSDGSFHLSLKSSILSSQESLNNSPVIEPKVAADSSTPNTALNVSNESDKENKSQDAKSTAVGADNSPKVAALTASKIGDSFFEAMEVDYPTDNDESLSGTTQRKSLGTRGSLGNTQMRKSGTILKSSIIVEDTDSVEDCVSLHLTCSDSDEPSCTNSNVEDKRHSNSPIVPLRTSPRKITENKHITKLTESDSITVSSDDDVIETKQVNYKLDSSTLVKSPSVTPSQLNVTYESNKDDESVSHDNDTSDVGNKSKRGDTSQLENVGIIDIEPATVSKKKSPLKLMKRRPSMYADITQKNSTNNSSPEEKAPTNRLSRTPNADKSTDKSTNISVLSESSSHVEKRYSGSFDETSLRQSMNRSNSATVINMVTNSDVPASDIKKFTGIKKRDSKEDESVHVDSNDDYLTNYIALKAASFNDDTDSSDDEYKPEESLLANEAEEGNEDTPSEGSNDIIEIGECIESTDNEQEVEDEEESNDSDAAFIDDDAVDDLYSENEAEDDLMFGTKLVKRKRILSRPTDEMEDEVFSNDSVDVKETTNKKDNKPEQDKTKPTDSVNTSSSNVKMNDSLLETSNKKVESPSQSRRKSLLSFTMHENLDVQEVETKLATKVSNFADLFCASISGNKGKVRLNVSLDYDEASSNEESVPTLLPVTVTENKKVDVQAVIVDSEHKKKAKKRKRPSSTVSKAPASAVSTPKIKVLQNIKITQNTEETRTVSTTEQFKPSAVDKLPDNIIVKLVEDEGCVSKTEVKNKKLKVQKPLSKRDKKRLFTPSRTNSSVSNWTPILQSIKKPSKSNNDRLVTMVPKEEFKAKILLSRQNKTATKKSFKNTLKTKRTF